MLYWACCFYVDRNYRLYCMLGLQLQKPYGQLTSAKGGDINVTSACNTSTTSIATLLMLMHIFYKALKRVCQKFPS